MKYLHFVLIQFFFQPSGKKMQVCKLRKSCDLLSTTKHRPPSLSYFSKKYGVGWFLFLKLRLGQVKLSLDLHHIVRIGVTIRPRRVQKQKKNHTHKARGLKQKLIVSIIRQMDVTDSVTHNVTYSIDDDNSVFGCLLTFFNKKCIVVIMFVEKN